MFACESSFRARRAPQIEESYEENAEDVGFGLFDGGDCKVGQSESDDDDEEPEKNPMEAKQSLLCILDAEVFFNSRLNSEVACFRTVFESWNPLLPRITTLTILEFFGVSDK